jgi:hypothetical protein
MEKIELHLVVLVKTSIEKILLEDGNADGMIILKRTIIKLDGRECN